MSDDSASLVRESVPPPNREDPRRRDDVRLVLAAVAVMLAVQAADRSGTLDASKLGAGDSPTELALDAGGERVWAASWNRRSVSLVEPSKGSVASLAIHARPFALAALPGGGAVVAGRYRDAACVITLVGESRLEDVCSKVARRVPDADPAQPALSPHVVALRGEAPARVLAAVAWRRRTQYRQWGLVRLALRGGQLRPIEASERLMADFFPRTVAKLTEHPASGRIWVGLPTVPTLFEFDHALVARRQLSLPEAPSALAVAPDGARVFIAQQLAGQVAMVGGDPWRVLATARVGDGPVDLAVSPDGKLLWVLLRQGRALVTLDAGSLSRLGAVGLDGMPWGMAASWDRRGAWISEPDRGRVEWLPRPGS